MRRDDVLSTGPAVIGAVLPLVAASSAVGAAFVLGAPFGWVVAVGAVVLIGGVVRVIGGPWLAGAVLVVVLIAGESDLWRTAVAVFAVHLLHVLGSLSLVVPLRARVTLAALRPTAIRFLLIQLIAQVCGVIATLLPQGRVVPAAVIAGALAVLAVAIGGRRMLRQQRASGFAAPVEPGA